LRRRHYYNPQTLRGPSGLILTRDPELGKKLDKAVFPGTQGPQNTLSPKAVAFGEALKPEFKVYSAQVIENAQALATQLQKGTSRLFRMARTTI